MKKEKILEVAEELFAEKGFEGTSVRDIAQKADVNIAMISYYFGSKEKLLEALIEMHSGYATMQLEELKNNHALDPWTKVEKMVDHYVDRLFNHFRFHNIMSRQISLIHDKQLKERMIHIKMKNLEIIRDIIKEGQKEKLFRKVDIELTVATIIGTISQATLSKYFYCKLLKVDETIGDEAYYHKINTRVKNHLKLLLRAHLDIKNA